MSTDSGLTVVLGWDGIDHELATRWELADAFGEHTRELETFDNDLLGKPHTHEIWPSIITGRSPNDHGIYAKTEDEGAAWNSRTVALAAQLATGFVPEHIRTSIGKIIRNAGAELDYKTPAYYQDRGIETVFDGRQSLSLAVPNYRTAADDALDMHFDRGAQLGEYLNITTDDQGRTRHEPSVPIHRLEQRLVSESMRKLGVVRSAIQREYDLVFVWLGYLDTVGHLAPTVDEDGWQRRAYEQAAKWTREVRSDLTDADTLLCVSDHGLRDGHHSHSAFFGADNEEVTQETETVLDVAAAIDAVTRSRTDGGVPEVRNSYRRETPSTAAEAEAVRDQLSDLGYL